LTARLFGEHQYEPDEIVYATPDQAHVHRFDVDDQAIR
jgi:multiple sugar transport system ATP-binding protein